jgi:tripartite-type tricarboxylate transporter receptor subunit TctC
MIGRVTIVAAAWVLALTIALFVALGCEPARADSVADFYRGRTIELDVGTGVGGGYDANARLVARHLARFLPGNPTIVVNNVPGGGGIRAANALYNKSPRDGSVIGTFSNAMITEPMLGNAQALFEPQKFTWIGSASREDVVCVAASGSGIESWNDLLQRDIVVGTAAPGTTTYLFPVMLRNLFGARFRPVSGYPDGGQIALALERGEVQSVCQTWSSIKVAHPDWLRDHKVVPLMTLGFSRLPELADIPSVMELATEVEQQQVLKIILAPTLAGRPFAAPPGIPSERAAALRDGFEAMTRDRLFVDEARQLRLDVQPSTSREIEALVHEIYALPQTVVAKTRLVATGSPGGK